MSLRKGISTHNLKIERKKKYHIAKEQMRLKGEAGTRIIRKVRGLKSEKIWARRIRGAGAPITETKKTK